MKPNALKIEIGCLDWEEPLLWSEGALSCAPKPSDSSHEAAPLRELLSVDHHKVLTHTLTQFRLLHSPNSTQAEIDQLKPTELSLYFTSAQQICQINLDYRGKDKPTNVLSFESDLPEEISNQLEHNPLGELVFCLEVIVREASDQGKSLKDHYTHLLVHGCLHLLGMDHETGEADQAQMEALEIEILAKLGIADPYQG